MNRSTRTLIVVLVGLVAATAASLLVYRTVVSRPTREVEVAHLYTVVASHSLTLGARVTKDDVKLVAWPVSSPIPGGMTTIEAALNRGVIAPIGENEPLTARNVASVEAGAGLPPSIPPGMRAISVRVNEVIGVAGFVVPGTRVDVMAVLKRGSESVASIVASNVQVLTSGTRSDQALDQAAPQRPATPSTVVTLMVTPEDAARIGLASIDGQIMLTLRNPLDTNDTAAASINGSSLAGGTAPSASAARAPEEPKRPRTRAVSAPAAAEPVAVAPPPPPPPPAYKVETIRAAKRTEETLR